MIEEGYDPLIKYSSVTRSPEANPRFDVAKIIEEGRALNQTKLLFSSIQEKEISEVTDERESDYRENDVE